MQVVLVMFTAAGDRRTFSLSKDVTMIGRREHADLRIPLGDVSRKHCRITLRGDTVRVNDLGSSNGTLVNGVRAESADLHPGDVLQVGPVQFVVQIDGDPADDAITPPAAPPPASADDLDLLPDAPASEDSFAAVLEGLPAGAAKSPADDDEEWDIISDEPAAGDAENEGTNR